MSRLLSESPGQASRLHELASKIGNGAAECFAGVSGFLNNHARHVPLRFGDCVFDAQARALTRAGRRVVLTPRAFELLAALVEARPRALSQAELRDRLWPRTHVAYSSLARLVSELRKATGDDRRGARLIRTVQRFGYAFAAAAISESDAAPGAFLLVRGSDEIPLREGENVIGRGPDCPVRIDSERVSRRHARILVDGARATLEDLGSKNGTHLDGRRIAGAVPLGPGAVIGVGPAVLVVRSGSGQGPTRTNTAERAKRSTS
jgi:DNA-binding winged helix-turn-helix (wHTH) protein